MISAIRTPDTSRNRKHRGLLSPQALVAAALLVLNAQAGATIVTYIYTGQHFTTVINTINPPSGYDTTMSVTGFMTFTSPLAPSTSYTDPLVAGLSDCGRRQSG